MIVAIPVQPVIHPDYQQLIDAGIPKAHLDHLDLTQKPRFPIQAKVNSQVTDFEISEGNGQIHPYAIITFNDGTQYHGEYRYGEGPKIGSGGNGAVDLPIMIIDDLPLTCIASLKNGDVTYSLSPFTAQADIDP